jgi:hypothetical protein
MQELHKEKWLITYYKTYGITTLKKHMHVNHFIIVKFFEEIKLTMK